MKGQQTVLATLTLVLQLGITMLVPIVGLTVLGAYLGRRLDAQWIPVMGFLMGTLGGAQGAWRIIRGVIRDWSVDPASAQGLREARRDGGADFADDPGREDERVKADQ